MKPRKAHSREFMATKGKFWKDSADEAWATKAKESYERISAKYNSNSTLNKI